MVHQRKGTPLLADTGEVLFPLGMRAEGVDPLPDLGPTSPKVADELPTWREPEAPAVKAVVRAKPASGRATTVVVLIALAAVGVALAWLLLR